MKKLRLFLLSAVLIWILAACGETSSEETLPETSGLQSSTDTYLAEKVDPDADPDKDSAAPSDSNDLGDFSAQDFAGNVVTKDIFADYDLTLVNLWTTTCGYCIEEMPVLNALREELQTAGKKFNIISVCMDLGDTDARNDALFEKAKKIIEKTGVTYPNLIPDHVLLSGRLHGIQAFPESFFVDAAGRVVSEPYVGAMPKNHWRVTINNELEKLAATTSEG